MVFIVTAENRHWFECDLLEMHLQRRRVFVEGLGWPLPHLDAALELDQYDGADVIDRGAYQAVFTMACFMFDGMLRSSASDECGGTRTLQFSQRERQCLELAAQGKDDWSIGSLLRISERTAHNHI